MTSSHNAIFAIRPYHACPIALRTLSNFRPRLSLAAQTLRTGVRHVHVNLLVNASRRLLKRQLHRNLSDGQKE